VSTIVNKKVFSVEVDGTPAKLAVVRPNHKVSESATLAYNRAYRRAVEAGSPVKAKVLDIMREQNLWDDTKQKKYEDILKTLFANEKKLAEGGIKLSAARDIAIQMRRGRIELRNLTSKRNEIEATTADSFAEQARFNYLVSACTVNADTGKPYYADVDEFLSKENDPVAMPASQNLGTLLYDLDEGFEAKLPENSFLKKYKLCNDELHLIDKQGRKVNVDGHLVDDKGRLINEDGQLVDSEGNFLTEDGDYKVDFVPFEDDVFEVTA
jgi:hypothetical protein